MCESKQEKNTYEITMSYCLFNLWKLFIEGTVDDLNHFLLFSDKNKWKYLNKFCDMCVYQTESKTESSFVTDCLIGAFIYDNKPKWGMK